MVKQYNNELTNLELNKEKEIVNLIINEDELVLTLEEMKTILKRVNDKCDLIVLGEFDSENLEKVNEFEQYAKLYKNYLEIEENRYS